MKTENQRDKMLNKNTTDSTIKFGIDAWYEKYLLDLKNYNELIKAYEDYLNNENNPVTPPTNPGGDAQSNAKPILIVLGCVIGACAIGALVFFVLKKSNGKGGKENEKNN